jgi:hypothetical protein
MPVVEFEFTAPGIAAARLNLPEVKAALATQSWPELHNVLTRAHREQAFAGAQQEGRRCGVS